MKLKLKLKFDYLWNEYVLYSFVIVIIFLRMVMLKLCFLVIELLIVKVLYLYWLLFDIVKYRKCNVIKSLCLFFENR